jgi:hypothetical protein
MVEEIITALSHIRWLFVIARNSTFTYKGQSVDVKQVGRELGVRYVLEGSVRKGGNRVRITGQLLPTHTAFSPRAMPKWGDSTKRARSSLGCAPLLQRSCRAIWDGATPRTANCCCRACASRWTNTRGANRASRGRLR